MVIAKKDNNCRSLTHLLDELIKSDKALEGPNVEYLNNSSTEDTQNRKNEVAR